MTRRIATVAGLFLGLCVIAGGGANPARVLSANGPDSVMPSTETLHLDGLNGPVQVVFESDGTPHISATTDHDFFLAIGYLHATFRLFQMDVQRRLGEGLLSEVVGPQTLASDEFEDRLGLQRNARAAWNALPADDPARLGLEAYAQGVNDRIAQDRASGELPILFSFLGKALPRPWTPLDSLVIYQVLTQSLDFNDVPLDYAVLVKHLGYNRTMKWFPVLPVDRQHPYDSGPYRMEKPAPLPAQVAVGPALAKAASSLVAALGQIRPSPLAGGGNSNNWAVTGAKTASGNALLAGDPHLSLTLPSVWYQYGVDSPSYHLRGVSFPGIPFIVIGRNQHVSWTETNGQDEATLYYLEKVDASHPNRYFWKGAWRPLRHWTYDIPVRGAATVHLDVAVTVHGPILPDSRLPGEAIAVDWMGAEPSHSVDAIIGVEQASNWSQFRRALQGWGAPTQNFAYADDRGNAGLISAGYYPVVKKGAPWLPLPGDGSADVTGFIPYRDIPQAYDPPSHFVFSANQRQVTGAYPYYIGTSTDEFDNGYRADRIYQVLSKGQKLTMQDMERLQNDTHDYLAGLIVPRLLTALSAATLSSPEKLAVTLLGTWNRDMTANASAASIWWLFWRQYERDTFRPWFLRYKLPSNLIDQILGSPSIDEDLEAWTLRDPTNPTFSSGGREATAAQVMRRAFAEAVASLIKKLGADPSGWGWGKLHTLEVDSLIGGPAIGPLPSGGDQWTVSSRHGGDYVSNAGPSWRMVVDWGTGQSVGVIPGGESEDFRSPWYKNQFDTWWHGQYYPMVDLATAQAAAGSITWTLQPTS